MVVPLLFIACLHFTKDDYYKASIKTPMVVRQGNDILVVTDLEKVLYDDAVDQAASHSQAGVFWTSGNNRPFCFSGVHDYCLSHPDLACRCSQSMASQKNNDTRAC